MKLLTGCLVFSALFANVNAGYERTEFKNLKCEKTHKTFAASGQIVQTCAKMCERMDGCEYFSVRGDGWCIGCTAVPTAKYSNTETYKMVEGEAVPEQTVRVKALRRGLYKSHQKLKALQLQEKRTEKEMGYMRLRIERLVRATKLFQEAQNKVKKVTQQLEDAASVPGGQLEFDRALGEVRKQNQELRLELEHTRRALGQMEDMTLCPREIESYLVGKVKQFRHNYFSRDDSAISLLFIATMVYWVLPGYLGITEEFEEAAEATKAKKEAAEAKAKKEAAKQKGDKDANQKAAGIAALARKAFHAADKNKNGSLTKSELRKYLKKHPAEKKAILGSDFRWNEIFPEMDTGGDTQFNVDEFTAFIVSRVAKKAAAADPTADPGPAGLETKEQKDEGDVNADPGPAGLETKEQKDEGDVNVPKKEEPEDPKSLPALCKRLTNAELISDNLDIFMFRTRPKDVRKIRDNGAKFSHVPQAVATVLADKLKSMTPRLLDNFHGEDLIEINALSSKKFKAKVKESLTEEQQGVLDLLTNMWVVLSEGDEKQTPEMMKTFFGLTFAPLLFSQESLWSDSETLAREFVVRQITVAMEPESADDDDEEEEAKPEEGTPMCPKRCGICESRTSKCTIEDVDACLTVTMAVLTMLCCLLALILHMLFEKEIDGMIDYVTGQPLLRSDAMTLSSS